MQKPPASWQEQSWALHGCRRMEVMGWRCPDGHSRMDARCWMCPSGCGRAGAAGQPYADDCVSLLDGPRENGWPWPCHPTWTMLAGLSRAVAASLAAPGTHCYAEPCASCSLQAHVPACGVGTLIPGEEGLVEALGAPKVQQAAPCLDLRCCHAGGCGLPWRGISHCPATPQATPWLQPE